MFQKPPLYVHTPKNLKDRDFELIGIEALEYSELNKLGVPVPSGFIISSMAFDDFLESSRIIKPIAEILKSIKPYEIDAPKKASQQILNLIYTSKFTSLISKPILHAYHNLSDSSEPIVQVRKSNIMAPEFIPETERSPIKHVKGDEPLFWAILHAWASLFSTEAIETRAAKGYKGPLTMGLLVELMAKPEISGKIYTVPPITQEEDTIEIRAMYGVGEMSSYIDSTSDKYLVKLSTGQIKEKSIVEQEVMHILKGKSVEDDTDEKVAVEIGKGWKKKQKINDDRILELTKITKSITTVFKGAQEISWGIEGGKVVVHNISRLKFIQKEPEKIDSKKSTEKSKAEFRKLLDFSNIKELVRPIKLQKLFQSGNKISLPETVTEVKQVEKELEKEESSGFKNLPVEDTKPREKNITKLELKKQQDKKVKVTSLSERTKIPLTLDISTLSTARLTALENFDTAFLDGTQIILNNGNVADGHIKDYSVMNQLLSAYSLEIATVMRIGKKKKFYYQFSNIGDEERRLLSHTDSSPDTNGDERLIKNPEALTLEGLSVQKALKESESGCDVSFVLPSPRSVENIIKLKKILYSSKLLKIYKEKQLYIEFAMPSLLMDIEQIDNKLCDGIIFNFDLFGKISFFKNSLTKEDASRVMQTLKSIVKIMKRNKVELIIKMGEYSDHLADEIFKLAPKGIILGNIPTEQRMEEFIKIEKEISK